MEDEDDLDEFEIEEQEAAVAAELDGSQSTIGVEKSLDEGSWFAYLSLFSHNDSIVCSHSLISLYTQARRFTIGGLQCLQVRSG